MDRSINKVSNVPKGLFTRFPDIHPLIYGKGNLQNPEGLRVLPLTTSDEASIHALIAVSGYNQLSLKERHLHHECNVEKDNLQLRVLEASFHVSEAVRLLNLRFENAKEALSVASIWCVAYLASCSVRDLSLF